MLGALPRLIHGGKTRLAMIGMAALAIVALLFTLSPVQTAAGSFLSIFRVKRFVAVTVDPNAMPKMARPAELGSFTTSGDPMPRVVTIGDAEKLIGFRLPLPSWFPKGLEPKPTAVAAAGPFTQTFVPDLKKVRAYLSSVGASKVKLPDSLDGAPITLQMAASAMVLYLEPGAAVRSSDGMPVPAAGKRFLNVGVTSSPTLNVPSGIDVEQIRSEILKMPGLPQELVSQLRAIDDWRSTAVVPVFKGTSHEVVVQGEKGLMITQGDSKGCSLIWPKDGRIYALSGTFSEDEILAVANSMR